MRYQPHRLDNRLGNEDAVERVLMIGGQVFHGRCMLGFNSHEVIPRIAEIRNGILAGNRHLTPPKTVLDRSLPHVGCTDTAIIIPDLEMPFNAVIADGALSSSGKGT